MPDNIAEIKNLVADDNLKGAIQQLKGLATENTDVNTLIILSGRYRELEVAIRQNILDWDRVKIEKSQIRKAILDLIDDLAAQNEGDQEFILDASGNERSFPQESFQQASSYEIRENPGLNITGADDDYRLEGLLLRFLSSYDRWYFSPLRIQRFGGRQSGFEELSGYSTNEITRVLLRLMEENKIKTTTSKKGNPIYKIK